MSNRYSLSPTLRLKIADSAQRRLGICALTVFYFAAAWLALHRGYAEVALLSGSYGAWVLWGISRYRWSASELGWSEGRWWVEAQGERRDIDLLPQSLALSWVIYIAFKEQPSGKRDCLWLFANSAPLHEQRKLRVRLKLLHV